MSFGVDTLGGLTEKLKQLVSDTQNLYEGFIDANQLYKTGKMNANEFFAKIGEYLVAMSALNFLAIRVVLEIKGAMDKGKFDQEPDRRKRPPPALRRDLASAALSAQEARRACSGWRIRTSQSANRANIQACRH